MKKDFLANLHIPRLMTCMQRQSEELTEGCPKKLYCQPLKGLRVPLASIDYDVFQPQTFSLYNCVATVKFSKVPDRLQNELVQHIKFMTGDDVIDTPIADPKTWRLLDGFSITESDSEVPVELIPEGYTVFFNPYFTESQNGFHQLATRHIVFTGDISAPSTLLIYLHELGHAFTHQEALQVEGEGKPGHYSAVALQSERLANAFVLKQIRRYLPNDKNLREDVLLFILHLSQHGYDTHHHRKKEEDDDIERGWVQLKKTLKSLQEQADDKPPGES